MRFFQQYARLLRGATATAAAVWGFYCYGYTASLGTQTVALFLYSSALVLPIALLPFLGYPLRRAAGKTLMLALFAWAIAYAWLTVEGTMLLYQARQTGTTTLVQRMWPFSNSAVLYQVGQGISWQD